MAGLGIPGRAQCFAFPLLVGALLVAWTLFCAAGWLLVQAGSALLAAGSGWLAAWPELLWWAQWTLRLLEGVGAGLLLFAWTFGVIGIVVGALVGRRLWRGLREARAAFDPRAPVATVVVPGEGAGAAVAAHPALPDGRRAAND